MTGCRSYSYRLFLKMESTLRAMPGHFFYLARCADGSLYAGTCLDPEERERKHNSGTGAKYTRSRRPVRIIYREELGTLSEARKREAEVKRWSKEEKEALVRRRRRRRTSPA
jgi:predicted GIY-YIG superfamily endonuclease